jgi:hypothetical protein
VTQWLIEEAAYLALELEDSRLRREASEEHQAEQQLLDRHAEMQALRDQMRVG